MTIYFQGTEPEAFNNGAVGVVANFNATYSRSAISEGNARSSVALSEVWIRVSAYNGSTILAVNDVPMAVYNLAGTQVMRAVMVTTNSFKWQYYNGTTWVDTGLTGIAGYWSALRDYVFHFKLGGSGASVVEAWVDGVLEGSVSPNLTSVSDFSTFGCFSPRGTTRYSEVVIADENLLLWNVKTAPATANGTDTGGTGVVGDINENGLTDATYVEFTTAGDKRSTTAAARTLARPIKGVTVTGRLLRVDATGPQQARPYLLIGGTRYYGTTFALTTGFQPYSYTWALNPATGLAWTNADANAATLESGWEAVA